jgi:hypothetical protein
MFNSMIIAAVKSYNQGKANKNGALPVILSVVAGNCPNRHVIDGSIAEREGLEVGKTYLISVTETAPDAEFGRRFTFTNLGVPTMMDIISSPKVLGAPVVFDVKASTVAPGAPVATPSVFETMPPVTTVAPKATAEVAPEVPNDMPFE